MSVLGQKWKLLMLMSIVVPMSLLVSLRLTGVLKETTIEVEEIALEPVTLNLSRPSETLERLNKSAQSKWTKEGISMTMGIHICSYLEGALAPFYCHDGLTFKTFANASSRQGYFTSMSISFHLLDNNSMVFLDTNRWSLEVLNGSIARLMYFGTNETDAYIEADVLNASCSLRDQIFWVLLDEHNQSHELQITMEVMHVNKTEAKIITVPIVLKMTPSGGNQQ